MMLSCRSAIATGSRLSFLTRQSLRHRRPFSSSYGDDSDSDDDETAEPYKPRKALILGSSGALGSYIAKHFSTELGMQVLGADLLELPSEMTQEWQLDAFCPIDSNGTLQDLTVRLTESVHDFCQDDTNGNNIAGLDCIVVASGGFAADPVTPKPVAPGTPLTREQLLQGASNYASTIDTMLRQNTHPVAAASYIAQHFMTATPPGGLLVVIGATAALQATPGLLGYGLSKAAAHQCITTMGASSGQSLDPKSVRQQGRKLRTHLPSLDHLCCVGILPTVLDTPANRKAMPNVDTTQTNWTSIAGLTAEISNLLVTPELRPHSGSLVKIFNSNDGTGRASLELVR